MVNHPRLSDRVVALCREALEYGIQPWEMLPNGSIYIRRTAAEILGRLKPIHYRAKIYHCLLKVMTADSEHEVRDGAYEALLHLARARDWQAVNG